MQTPYSRENNNISGYPPLRDRSRSGTRPQSKLDTSHVTHSEMGHSDAKAQFLAQRLSNTQDDISVDAIPTRLTDQPPSHSHTGSKSNEKNRLTRFKKVEKELGQEKEMREMELQRLEREADEREREIRLQQHLQAEQARRRQE